MINVNIVTNPATYSPSNSEIWFRLNSASYSVTDFHYVFDLFLLDGLSNAIQNLGSYPVPPRPGNGDGLFTPSKILNSLVDSDLKPTVTTITESSNSMRQYSINYGYQWSPSLRFTDTFISGTSVGFTFSQPHGLLTGDVINISKDNKNVNSYYDGLSTVISVGTTYSITIDKPIGNINYVESGYVTFMKRIEGQTDDFFVYNGTRQYDERTKDFGINYVGKTGSATFSFLENYNGYKPIFLDQWETSQIFTENINGLEFNIETYDNNLNFILDADFGNYGVTGSGTLGYIIPTGTKNHILMGFTFSDDVKYYRIYARYGTTGSIVADLWRKIECNNSVYNNIRIAYLNSIGSYEYMNFNYDNKRTISIERSEYQKTLEWDYEMGDRGTTILSQKMEESYQLNSDWISESQYAYYFDLVKSTRVFIIDDLGQKWPVNITDSNFEFKTYLRDKVFNLTINVKSAYQIKGHNE